MMVTQAILLNEVYINIGKINKFIIKGILQEDIIIGKFNTVSVWKKIMFV